MGATEVGQVIRAVAEVSPASGLMLLAKRIGNIHPLITLAGVVLGVELFGIMGLVIGPLLLSYFIVLMKVFERENRMRTTVHSPNEL